MLWISSSMYSGTSFCSFTHSAIASTVFLAHMDIHHFGEIQQQMEVRVLVIVFQMLVFFQIFFNIVDSLRLLTVRHRKVGGFQNAEAVVLRLSVGHVDNEKVGLDLSHVATLVKKGWREIISFELTSRMF